MLEVLLLHSWQNNGKPGRQINVIRRKELVLFSQEWRRRPILEKRNREHRPPTGLRYRVSIYRKFLLSVVVVIVVDLIQLELLSHFSRDKEKGVQNVLKLAKIEYRISSKNRALISNFSEKDRCLFEGERLIDGALINRTRERLSCF